MSSWKTGKCSGADFSGHSERSAAKLRISGWLRIEFKIRDVSTPLDMTNDVRKPGK